MFQRFQIQLVRLIIAVFLTSSYLAIGVLIATPYTWAADGNADNFLTTMLVGPAALFALVIAYFTGMVVSRSKTGGPFFWGVAVYLLLPIILNGASLAAKAAGYDALARILYELRYYSIPAGPVLVLLMAIAWDGVNKTLNRLERYWPTNTVCA